MTQQLQSQSRTALVIGGSMAGLLAARVLSEFYAEVTILERDHIKGVTGPRKGVPQAKHAHALLPKGKEILEELLPGLTESLTGGGAPVGLGRFFLGGGRLQPLRERPGGLLVSRPFLEAEVRARVLALPNVRILEGFDAKDLVADAERTRVTGVRVVSRQADAAETDLCADLVLDASGRGSRTPAWIEALGYRKPEVELVEVDMHYTTRHFRRRPGEMDGDLFFNIGPTRDNRRGCGMFAQEGDQWIVTLAGYFGDRPPTDDQGYLDFARRLPDPAVHNFIRNAAPLGEPAVYHFPANQRRRYECLDRFPEGLLVMGDALCSFTPIYGQGMTVAGLEALALRECLRHGRRNLARRFFRQAGRTVDIAWMISAGNDKRLSGADAGAPLPLRLINWYMDKLLVAARRDADISTAFLNFTAFGTSPASLLRPLMMWRVLWAHLAGGAGRESVGAASESLPELAQP